ncbi:acyl carrier protein [Pleurocapsa sp. PCC 7319]|uniref:acyl carrier protein n=1 Tax=Pleurocapsa sp. PCC 7319 TaxID=118161 RepID=UPI00034978FB|nr:acyl carrier protein [Pleurocapsa sp. PCC 7319]
MKNNASSNISTTTENNFLATHSTELKQNDKTISSTDSNVQSSDLLTSEVNNIQDYSDHICRNWLKAHKTKSLDLENIQQYTKIVILLQDIIELIDKIKTAIQCTQLQKLEICKTVCSVISNCLGIEPKQVTLTTNLANDLGINSLEWQELLIALEERFAIKISDDIAETWLTVQQIIDCVVLTVREKNYCLKYNLEW